MRMLSSLHGNEVLVALGRDGKRYQKWSTIILLLGYLIVASSGEQTAKDSSSSINAEHEMERKRQDLIPYPRMGRSLDSIREILLNIEGEDIASASSELARNFDDETQLKNKALPSRVVPLAMKQEKHRSHKLPDSSVPASEYMLPYPRPGRAEDEESPSQNWMIPQARFGRSNPESRYTWKLQELSEEPNILLPYPRLGRSEYDGTSLGLSVGITRRGELVPYPRLGRSQNSKQSKPGYSTKERQLEKNFAVSYPRYGIKGENDIINEFITPYPRMGKKSSASLLPSMRLGRAEDEDAVEIDVPVSETGKRSSESMLPYPRLGRNREELMLPYPRLGKSSEDLMIPYPRLGRSSEALILPYPRIGRSTEELMLPYPRLGRSTEELMLPYPRLGRSTEELMLPYPRLGRSTEELILPYPRLGRSSEGLMLPYPRLGKSLKLATTSIGPSDRDSDGIFARSVTRRSESTEHEDTEKTNNDTISLFSEPEDQTTLIPYPRFGRSKILHTRKRRQIDEQFNLLPYPRLGRDSSIQKVSSNKYIAGVNPQINSQTEKILEKIMNNQHDPVYLLPYPRPGRTAELTGYMETDDASDNLITIIPFPRMGRA